MGLMCSAWYAEAGEIMTVSVTGPRRERHRCASAQAISEKLKPEAIQLPMSCFTGSTKPLGHTETDRFDTCCS